MTPTLLNYQAVVEFITILSNGIDQNPLTEITEQLHVSFRTSDEFTDEEHSIILQADSIKKSAKLGGNSTTTTKWKQQNLLRTLKILNVIDFVNGLLRGLGLKVI